MGVVVRERSDSGSRSAVRRRHVIYVEGYDQRGAEGYYRLFQRECDRARQTSQISLTLQPLELDTEDFAHWLIDLRVPDPERASHVNVATHYDFVRMERFVRSDLAAPMVPHVLRSLGWIIGDLVSGTAFRIFRASWRFGLHLLCFQFLLVAWLAAAAAVGITIAHAATRHLGLSGPAAIVLAVLGAVMSFVLIRPLADRWFVIQITSCWVTLRKFGRGQAIWVDHVVELCAQRLLAVARANTVDELVLVGHSTGGAIALAAMARALEFDPDLGRRGVRPVLLTLGSVMPAVALHPSAERLRDMVSRVAVEPTVTWVDCQSRKDVMCFFNFDPVDGIGVHVGAERCNPLIWRISFKDMIAPENYSRFRWNHFRVHYQYIMGGERPAPYDYILVVGGPMPIAQWPTHDRAFMAAMMRDEAGRQRPLAAAALGAAQ